MSVLENFTTLLQQFTAEQITADEFADQYSDLWTTYRSDLLIISTMHERILFDPFAEAQLYISEREDPHADMEVVISEFRHLVEEVLVHLSELENPSGKKRRIPFRVVVSADQSGRLMARDLINALKAKGFSVTARGLDDDHAAQLYPDVVDDVGDRILNFRPKRGIVCCSNPSGAAIAANKIMGIYAAACNTPREAVRDVTENNINLLILDSRLGLERGTKIAIAFLTHLYDYFDESHAAVVEKIEALEWRKHPRRVVLIRRVVDHLTFDEWIKETFKHDEKGSLYWSARETDPIYWDVTGHPATALEYLARLYENASEVLSLYTDQQIGNGLTFLLESPIHSLLWREDVAFEIRMRVIHAIFALFEQFFAIKCGDRTTHYTGDAKFSPINDVCFMWWDLFPWHGAAQTPHQEAVFTALLSVIVKCLKLDSLACVESALHGLGEYHKSNRQDMRGIEVIDRFLHSRRDLDRSLKRFALHAREGYIL
jgi:RpiB/LacA/LacB family sugar-phosphate isomerase